MIEKLDVKDFKKYLKLINGFRPVGNFTEKDFKKAYQYMKNYSKIFVYKEKDQLIGSITVIIEQKIIYNLCRVGHIEDVFVDKKFRGKKIGSKLIDFAIEFCKENECRKVILVCSDDVKKFYESNGFEKRGNHMSCLLVQ